MNVGVCIINTICYVKDYDWCPSSIKPRMPVEFLFWTLMSIDQELPLKATIHEALAETPVGLI